MQQRQLGRSGLRVSAVGLGCNNFGGRLDDAASREVVHGALDLGITLFDTADVYGRPHKGRSEEILGECLGARRKDIVLATKFGLEMAPEGPPHGGSRRYVMAAVEASLKRLKTDWIDLYQLHFPDPKTPIAETLRALDDLTRQGKIRYAGVSNMPAWQVADAVWTARSLGLNGLVSCQDEYSLLCRAPEQELLPAVGALGLGLLPYFPLASGMLTGKYRRHAIPNTGVRLVTTKPLAEHFLTDAKLDIAERLAEFCAARGRSLLELAFSWQLSHPEVGSVIAGATSRAQLAENIAATGWALSAAELAEVHAIAPPLTRGMHA